MQHSPDPASLEHLRDIVEPTPVSLWWPPAPGWCILLALLLLAFVLFSIKWIRTRRVNRYRHDALNELNKLSDITRLPKLLKRTALAVFPRDMVASISGERWINFLNTTTPDSFFSGDTGKHLLSVSYSHDIISDKHKSELIAAVKNWIVTHSPVHIHSRSIPKLVKIPEKNQE
jgi:hypothetical protein